jgi:hypothetical protein
MCQGGKFIMKIEFINCPYCGIEQKVFHLNYTLIQLLKKIDPSNEKVLLLRSYVNPNKFIRNFNCKNCKEKLSVYYNIETYQYFIHGEKLIQIQEKIIRIRQKIKKLRKKIIVTYNTQIINLLKLEIDKETLALDHFISQDVQERNKKTLQLDQVVNS